MLSFGKVLCRCWWNRARALRLSLKGLVSTLRRGLRVHAWNRFKLWRVPRLGAWRQPNGLCNMSNEVECVPWKLSTWLCFGSLRIYGRKRWPSRLSTKCFTKYKTILYEFLGIKSRLYFKCDRHQRTTVRLGFWRFRNAVPGQLWIEWRCALWESYARDSGCSKWGAEFLIL